MVALVIFPDTDTLARKCLLQGLAEHGVTGIAVGTRLPSPMQNRFIRCYTIGGHETGRRTQPCQVICQVYDTKDNDVRCSQLTRLCAAVLRSAPDMVIDGEQPISEPCETQGPFPYEDPDWPGIPRYQVTVTWTVQSTVTE
jgi:hypothetical protein